MVDKSTWLRIALSWLACQLLFAGPLQADASRPAFTGQVTDDTGEPLAGVRVDISTAAPRVGRGIFCPSCYEDCGKWATTDERGRFEIAGLDPTLKFRLLIAFPKFKTEHTDLLDPAAGVVNVRLRRLPTDSDPDRFVTGTAVSEQGVAIAGALVSPYGAKTAQRRWWGRVDGVDSTVTDSEGGFAMLVPEDFQALDIEIVAHGYAGKLVYELKPGTEPAIIAVPTGASVVGKLTRYGAPVSNLKIAVAQTNRTVNPDRGILIGAVAAVTDIEGNFEFHNLPPSQQYCIYFVVGDAQRGENDPVLTVKKFNVPGSGQRRDLGTLEVADPISIRGRIESVDGKPLPQDLSLSFGRDPAWDLVAFPVAADGSFNAVGLPPESYEIRLGSRDLAIASERLVNQALSEQSIGVYATESIAEWVIPVRGKTDGGLVTLPAAEPASSGQQLGGIVVDPDGNPVADVQISTRLTSGQSLARPLRGPPPWARTDGSGRFTIGNLPDEPVQLMAYRSQPGGGIIRYPAYALPPLNAQDIRIVLDPRLGSGVEDLDAE